MQRGPSPTRTGPLRVSHTRMLFVAMVFGMAELDYVPLLNAGKPMIVTPCNESCRHSCNRYYAQTPSHLYPPEVHDYNARFTRTLETIKRRHDPTVATVAQGVLEWLRARGVKPGSGVGGSNGLALPGGEVQAWLDRFYLSRIGIRFLIGQREYNRGLLRC